MFRHLANAAVMTFHMKKDATHFALVNVLLQEIQTEGIFIHHMQRMQRGIQTKTFGFILL